MASAYCLYAAWFALSMSLFCSKASSWAVLNGSIGSYHGGSGTYTWSLIAACAAPKCPAWVLNVDADSLAIV